MRVAVVDKTTGEVLNAIVAEATDPAPEGARLVSIGLAYVGPGYFVQENGDFTLTVSAAEVTKGVQDEAVAVAADAAVAALEP